MKKGVRKVVRRTSRFARKIRRNLRRKPHPDAVYSEYGIWLQPQHDDMTFHLYRDGGYGEFLAKLLKSQRNNFVFLDVGANQGLYSILAAKNKACQQIIALEPVTRTADVLERNIALNKSRRVSVIRKGISDVAGQADIHFNADHSGVATIRDDILAGAEVIPIDVMDAAALNMLLGEVTAPIIMKVDVEGYEMTVLKELAKTVFFPRIRMIFYECDERWVDPAEIRALLSREGFASFQQVGDGEHYDVLATR